MTEAADIVKQSAPLFLYTFINQEARLPQAVMNKRARQTALLNRIASKAGVSYHILKDAVYSGIVEQFGKTPAQLLTEIYQTASVGTTEDKKPTFWDSLGDILNAVGDGLNKFAGGNGSGNSTSNTSNTNNTTNTAPNASDWKVSGSGIFSADNLILYGVGAALLFFIYKTVSD